MRVRVRVSVSSSLLPPSLLTLAPLQSPPYPLLSFAIFATMGEKEAKADDDTLRDPAPYLSPPPLAPISPLLSPSQQDDDAGFTGRYTRVEQTAPRALLQGAFPRDDDPFGLPKVQLLAASLGLGFAFARGLFLAAISRGRNIPFSLAFVTGTRATAPWYIGGFTLAASADWLGNRVGGDPEVKQRQRDYDLP